MNTIQIDDKSFKIMLENDVIGKRIQLLATQLNLDYENRCPLFIGVLNGSFIFMSDLVKEIIISCEISFIKVSSYEGTESTGLVKEVFGLLPDLEGRDVILIEDIVDTGVTLKYILEKVHLQKPASVRACSLLLKPAVLKAPVEELHYVGFEIPNDFVVGYGLDYNGLGRNFKDIYKAVI